MGPWAPALGDFDLAELGIGQESAFLATTSLLGTLNHFTKGCKIRLTKTVALQLNFKSTFSLSTGVMKLK